MNAPVVLRFVMVVVGWGILAFSSNFLIGHYVVGFFDVATPPLETTLRSAGQAAGVVMLAFVVMLLAVRELRIKSGIHKR